MNPARRRSRRSVASAVFASIAVSMISLAALADRDSDERFSLSTLSTRPQLVSAGDVLVRVSVPREVSFSDVEVRLNGADVTASFQPDAGGDALVGLVTGLRDGENLLTAATRRARPSHEARLGLRNAPAYGPVFSGPHQRPWICETATSGLGAPPASGPCVAATIYEWFY